MHTFVVGFTTGYDKDPNMRTYLFANVFLEKPKQLIMFENFIPLTNGFEDFFLPTNEYVVAVVFIYVRRNRVTADPTHDYIC